MIQLSTSSGSWADAAIEVHSADDLLGIGLGTDILIVDDDEANLTAFEAALDPLGRRLVLARSGVSALAKLLEQDFALLLLDVSMPNMNGLETARRIRERARNKGLPIIFITGLASSTEVVLEAYDAGAFDFVVKPVPPEILRAKVRVYLQLQERTQAFLRYATQLREARASLADLKDQLRERDATIATAHQLQRQATDELLAMLGHELRNPLWAMVNALELVKARDQPSSHELATFERQVGHLTHIVGDLLDAARIKHGKISLRRETVQLAGIVASAIAGARASIDRRGHEVIVNVPGDLLLDADRHRVRQVLDNLLGNALKYTPEGGRIEISAAADGPFVRVDVRDDGRGIPGSLLASVFDPFVHGDQALDRGDGGAGIGLALARTLVDLHGGTIEARSDGPGRGAIFTVRWPRIPEVPGSRAIAGSAAAAGRRVLIVDDNTDAADLLAELLRTLGHDVAVAANGPAGIEAASSFAPHLALLDIGLPVMDGYELAGRLRLLEACRNTLLVAVSGYSQPDHRQRSKAAGFAFHLVKPVGRTAIESLLAQVQDHEAP